MKVVDFKSVPKKINIPSIASNRVTVVTNCALTEDEITLFNASISG